MSDDDDGNGRSRVQALSTLGMRVAWSRVKVRNIRPHDPKVQEDLVETVLSIYSLSLILMHRNLS